MSPNFTLRTRVLSLNKADTRSLDFAVTRFLMKMFRTVNMDMINECRFYFDFMLPMVSCWSRERATSCGSCSIVCHFGFAKCVKCVWQLFIFLLLKLNKFFSLSFFILLPVMVNKDIHSPESWHSNNDSIHARARVMWRNCITKLLGLMVYDRVKSEVIVGWRLASFRASN